MRGWIRLGLVATALWVIASTVTIIYQGKSPTWREVKAAEYADWYHHKVELGTGRSVADWDRQMAGALEVCLDAQARKPQAERNPEICNISLRYTEPSVLETMAIQFRAISHLMGEWLRTFVLPILLWSFFMPFSFWFVTIGGTLLVLRLRGERPHPSAQRNGFFKDMF
jgi:hypothetical protein